MYVNIAQDWVDLEYTPTYWLKQNTSFKKSRRRRTKKDASFTNRQYMSILKYILIYQNKDM